MMGSSGAQYLLLLLLASVEGSTGLESGSNKKPVLSWVRPGVLTHQTLHSVLVSIEEKLRSLESVKYTTNRLDLYLETFSRQLDSLDVRTRAVQIKLEQLETVAQSLVSQGLKNDLSTVHLQRKFETNQDRLIHKISLTENRLDSSITKLQGTIDLGFEKVEKKQNEYQTKLSTISTVLDEITQRLMKLEDSSNNTIQVVQQNKISATDISRYSHINRITDMLEGIEKHVNKSIMISEQNDSPKNHPKEDNKIKEIIKTEFHSEANKIGNKINNMYNDLWGKTINIERLINDVISISNVTKIKTNDNNPSAAEDIRCSETIQSVMEEMLGTLGSYLQEKLESMDTNVEGIFGTHKMLLGAYNKMREDKNQFEDKLTLVLSKIIDTIENRTKTVDDVQRRTLEALKSHNSQVVRTVAYNTNSLKKLAEDTGVEHKSLDNTLIQLLNYVTSEKHESQEYEDNINDPFNKRRHHEEREMKVEQIIETVLNNSKPVGPNTTDSTVVNGINTRTDNSQRHRQKKHKDDYVDERTGLVTDTEDIITDFDNSQFHDRNQVSSPLEDENDKAVTRLLMLYLKTLKGHLSKEKFLQEANPQQPYSSVQDMIKHLKEKNFPSDFLKELEELDNETNDKETNEDLNEGKEFTENPNEDYDRDYLDYPAHDTN